MLDGGPYRGPADPEALPRNRKTLTPPVGRAEPSALRGYCQGFRGNCWRLLQDKYGEPGKQACRITDMFQLVLDYARILLCTRRQALAGTAVKIAQLGIPDSLVGEQVATYQYCLNENQGNKRAAQERSPHPLAQQDPTRALAHFASCMPVDMNDNGHSTLFLSPMGQKYKVPSSVHFRKLFYIANRQLVVLEPWQITSICKSHRLPAAFNSRMKMGRPYQ